MDLILVRAVVGVAVSKLRQSEDRDLATVLYQSALMPLDAALAATDVPDAMPL